MSVLTQIKIEYQTHKDDIHIVIQDVPAEIVTENGIEHQLFNMETAIRLESIIQTVRNSATRGDTHTLRFSDS
jgi:hypothetical protein